MAECGSSRNPKKIRELHHAATDIMAATNVEEVYKTTVGMAEAVLEFDFCYICVVEDGQFTVAASTDLDRGTTMPYTESDGVIGKTYREKESFVAREIPEHEESLPLDEVGPLEAATSVEQPFRSGLSVPVGDDAVLQAMSSTGGEYTEHELELAELLAVHTEAALEQVRSEQLLKEKTAKIEELHAVATELESCRTHDELFDLIIDASREILGFGWCALLLVEDGEFVVGAASEIAPITVGERVFTTGESVARRIYETGESSLTGDVRRTEDSNPVSDDIRSGIQVPVGDIGVYSAMHHHVDAFDETDRELAELLAASVAEAFERIEVQNQLRDQKQTLERQNARLDQFASIITHDLRNPLNVAQLRTQLLAQDHDSEHIEPIQNAHGRMEAMLGDLLTVVRAETVVDETESIDIEQQVTVAWESVRTAEATLETAVPDGWTVEGAPELLDHVFENLFRNAVEHGSTGSRANPDDADTGVHVRVGTFDNGEDSPAGFYVEDDGDGIPEGKQADVFEHGYTTSDDGEGFGLAIVNDLVAAHGWEVTVTDGTAGGARFEIRTTADDEPTAIE